MAGKVALITGATGQDGAYLAELLLGKGYTVHGMKRPASSLNTGRIDHLYRDPHETGTRFFLHYGDLTDATNLIRLIQETQPDEIYNLAAQSHVAVSFETPEYTANSDALGTLRLLEAIRILRMEQKVRFYQASTSELYGNAKETPQRETTPFAPRSPYAAAKLYAYWITVNYREAYGIHASNGILFNHESPIRGAGLRLLQHHPHVLDIVERMAPVALGIEIADVELFLLAGVNGRDRARHAGAPPRERDLHRAYGAASAGRFAPPGPGRTLDAKRAAAGGRDCGGQGRRHFRQQLAARRFPSRQSRYSNQHHRVRACDRLEKLLFLGSSCIYPRLAPQPMREDALLTGPLEPTNQWYAIAKIAGMMLCRAHRRQHGCDFISAMPTNLYGPGDNFNLQTSHVVPALLAKAHAVKTSGAGEITVWGTGTPLREFMYVDDLADALVFLLKHYSGEEHVNVGAGSETSIRELAGLIARIVGVASRLRFDTSLHDGAPRKALDSSKLFAMGWKPQTELEEGLRQTYAWYLTPTGGDSG